MHLDVAAIRAEFPALGRDIRGNQLIYLDSAATSHKPRAVLDAERDFYENHNAAVHRGAHTVAAEATDLFEDARASVARYLGAADDEVVFTANATESINLVAHAFLSASTRRTGYDSSQFRLGEGDEIVVTQLEHHANLIPWQELAAHTGATLRYIPVDEAGQLLMEHAAAIIGPRTRVLAFAHASNVLGALNPVTQLVALARAAGALVVLDACQTAPHHSIDVKELDVDFAVLSGHKMLAPLGIGVLYGRRDLLNTMPPFHTGGSMITTVTMEHAEYLPAPARFEAGTQPVAQAVGLRAAIDYLEALGMDNVAQRDAELGQALAVGLAAIPGIRILGPAPGEPRLGLVSFVVDGVHAHDVGQFLDERGIAVRVGHHCAQPLHRHLGVAASTRASAAVYTTDDEVQSFLESVGEIRSYFRVA